MLRIQLARQSRAVLGSVSKQAPTVSRSRLPQALSPSSVHRSIPLRYIVPQAAQKRWQSTEESKPANEEKTTEEVTKGAESSTDDAIRAELEKNKKEVAELKDKYLRSVADYRNLQDRTKRDMDAARQFAIQKFSTDLLDSIDNLDRALIAVPKESTEGDSANKDLVNLFSGLKMTNEILLNTLKKHGLERFDPIEREGGAKFDPQLDEATFFTKVEGKPDGEVFYTQSKGFTLNGRVIRAAKVGVVKNS